MAETEREQLDCLCVRMLDNGRDRERTTRLFVCETARHNGRDTKRTTRLFVCETARQWYDTERTTRLFVCDCVILLDAMAETEREQLDCLCVIV